MIPLSIIDIENKIFKIESNHSFVSEESSTLSITTYPEIEKKKKQEKMLPWRACKGRIGHGCVRASPQWRPSFCSSSVGETWAGRIGATRRRVAATSIEENPGRVAHSWNNSDALQWSCSCCCNKVHYPHFSPNLPLKHHTFLHCLLPIINFCINEITNITNQRKINKSDLDELVEVDLHFLESPHK